MSTNNEKGSKIETHKNKRIIENNKIDLITNIQRTTESENKKTHERMKCKRHVFFVVIFSSFLRWENYED